MTGLVLAAVFIIGLCIGSFLNVCIYRMPRDESIVKPGSHCPACNKPIAWFDNLPLISYIFLLGRCRHCRAKISPLYFVVELLTALLLVALARQFGISAKFFIYSLLAAGLVVATFVDFAHQLIPDTVTLGGLATGLILSAVFPTLHGQASWKFGLRESLIGALAGGASIYFIGVVGKLIFRKESMGGGDVKLLAMVGSFLGWKAALLIFFIAPVFGAIVGIILKLKYKAEIIPYGPYLALATVIAIFRGERIIRFLSLIHI